MWAGLCPDCTLGTLTYIVLLIYQRPIWSTVCMSLTMLMCICYISHNCWSQIIKYVFYVKSEGSTMLCADSACSVSSKVIHITGRLRIRMALTHSRNVPIQIMGMVVVAHALPPPTINEVRIDCQMFVTRVNMDLNIVYCENRYWPSSFLPSSEMCWFKFIF